MPDLMLDGVRYVPEHDATAHPTIGVAVTTRNRNQVAADTVARIREHTPGAVIVVVDDASTEPFDGATYRFETQAGIARAKNKCLELLAAAGVEHLFLFDDDAYPLVDDWWRPYAESPEPHLMRIFEDLSGPKKLKDIKRLPADGRHVAYTGPRGVMLYVHRTVLDVVGGMDPIYGTWGYEHGDWSNRIHHAGLTTWRYADVAGSSDLVYSLDEHEKITRVVPGTERAALVKSNAEIHNDRVRTGYTAYVEYREQVDVVITTLLTSQPDPQRGKKWDPDPGILDAWAKSLTGHRAVVLADELTEAPHGALLETVPDVPMNVYYRRWLHIYQHLRDHPECRFVWCTDGSDVELLHDPFPHMRPGRLYVGSEPKIVADEWMRKNHPARLFQDFLDEDPHRTMLNAGLLGGTREDVMEFAHRMLAVFYDLESARFWRKEAPGREVGDMAAFNLVAREHYGDRLVTGPVVHTLFKHEERTPWAWWRHR